MNYQRQCWMLTIILAGACSSASVGPETDEALLAGLGYVRVGEVTRNEVEARLGPPQASYEGGRITSYMLTEDRWQLRLASADRSPKFDLMLVYGDDGRLANRSLVRKR